MVVGGACARRVVNTNNNWLATVSRGAGHGVQNGVAERYGDVSYTVDIKLITTINPRKVLTTRKKRTTYLRIGKTEAMITRRDRF